MRDEPFTVTECARCPDLVLTGMVGGLRFRLDRHTIPPVHAAVVKRYGISVLVLTPRFGGYFGDFWVPGTGGILAIPHVCYSEHSMKGSTK